MKNFTLKRIHIVLITIVWWLAFAILSATSHNEFQALNIIGFSFLALVPGVLTVLSLRLKTLPFFATLSLSVAFSILELMTVGLLGNFLLQKFGISHPLLQSILIIEINALILTLLFIAWKRLLGWELHIENKLQKLFPTKLDAILSFFPILFVLQSIIGAFRLNNGASGLWTLAMLGEIAIYSLILYFYSKKIEENTIPIAFYFIGLAMLLMTSLRGWYITGHDIQQEYKVFELTKNAGVWNMAFFRDAYNACLSITILPTIFFNLLKVSDPYIFKFFFQFFFAFCPGIAYLISRHWTNKRISLLTALYFVAFPTFFIDMPFLVRQEVAFLFYGLMLYIIFEPSVDLFIRRNLFVMMGIGVVLSHYSTTYTIIVIFSLTAVSRPILIKLLKFFKEKWVSFAHSPLNSSQPEITDNKAKITLVMIVTLALASFIWTSLVTNTGGSVSKVLISTLNAIQSGFTENTRSTDAVNLLSFRKPSQQEELETYIKKVINPIRAKSQLDTYYKESEYQQYKFIALPDEQLPLTQFGSFIQEKTGVDFASLMTTIGRAFAKLMEILVPLGMIGLLYRKSLIKRIDSELYLIACHALTFIFLIIVVPVLSTEYGIYRAMQQSMYVLAIPMVAGSLLMTHWIQNIKKFFYSFYLKIKKIQIQNSYSPHESAFPIILALIFFLYSTSSILQIFGKNPALLYFSNTGRYYDNYLIKAPEISAVSWLSSITNENINAISGVKIKIQTDRYSQRKLASLSSLDAYNDIFPGVVAKDAYVFLGQATTRKQRATLVYGGDQITYTYPIQFLDENKNLIYSNGSAKIYR